MFELYEPEEEVVVKKPKKASAFDVLKAITNVKNLKDLNYKPSDCFFILTLMCYNQQLRKYATPFISRYGKVPNKKILEILEKIIPKKFFKCSRRIKKSHEDSLVIRVSEFFNVSDDVAIEYLDTVTLTGDYNEFIEHFDIGGLV